jgi:hypothetical protein
MFEHHTVAFASDATSTIRASPNRLTVSAVTGTKLWDWTLKFLVRTMPAAD